MPERIVVVTDYTTVGGGASSVALTSIRLLRRRGLNVTVLSGDNGTNSELADLGVEVVALSGADILQGARGSAALRGLYNVNARALLHKWIDTCDSDKVVYHLHTWSRILSPSIFLALNRVASRLVISAHDFFLVCPNGGFFNFPAQQICSLTPMSWSCLRCPCDRRSYTHKLWRTVRQAVRRTIFDLNRTSATVLAVHNGMIPFLVRGGIRPRNLRVLRNPVMPWRTDRVEAERNRVAFFVGRLDGEKGADLLARAARRASVPLRIVGLGSQLSLLAREHPEAELMGWQTQEAIAQLIGDARILVMPTRSPEPFGLVALEAMMSGVPVVVSRNAFLSEEIVRLGFGLACDPTDEAALENAISTLARDDDLVETMSRRAFAGSHDLALSPDQWGDQLLELYKNKLSCSH